MLIQRRRPRTITSGTFVAAEPQGLTQGNWHRLVKQHGSDFTDTRAWATEHLKTSIETGPVPSRNSQPEERNDDRTRHLL